MNSDEGTGLSLNRAVGQPGRVFQIVRPADSLPSSLWDYASLGIETAEKSLLSA